MNYMSDSQKRNGPWWLPSSWWELGVILFVLVVIAGMLMPSYICWNPVNPVGYARQEARQEARAIKTALEQYRTDYGKWPLKVQSDRQWEKPASEKLYDQIFAG